MYENIIRCLLFEDRIPLSIETESEGRPYIPQFLISTGLPKVFTKEYFSLNGILFSMHKSIHFSTSCSR
jgi:hypothetical protein